MRNKDIESRLMVCNSTEELKLISSKIVNELAEKVRKRKRIR